LLILNRSRFAALDAVSFICNRRGDAQAGRCFGVGVRGSAIEGKFDRPECCPTTVPINGPLRKKGAALSFAINMIALDDPSPEKAGVGGSIPSLATTSFQTLTSAFVPEVCPCGVQMESILDSSPKW